MKGIWVVNHTGTILALVNEVILRKRKNPQYSGLWDLVANTASSDGLILGSYDNANYAAKVFDAVVAAAASGANFVDLREVA